MVALLSIMWPISCMHQRPISIFIPNWLVLFLVYFVYTDIERYTSVVRFGRKLSSTSVNAIMQINGFRMKLFVLKMDYCRKSPWRVRSNRRKKNNGENEDYSIWLREYAIRVCIKWEKHAPDKRGEREREWGQMIDDDRKGEWIKGESFDVQLLMNRLSINIPTFKELDFCDLSQKTRNELVLRKTKVYSYFLKTRRSDLTLTS